KGVGAALYEGRRKLCKRLNLRRIVAGGRLFSYGEHAERLSPEEYVAQVEAGEIRDRMLSFQIREGFSTRGLLPNYLPDPASHDYAAFLEWLNPDYRPVPRGQRKV